MTTDVDGLLERLALVAPAMIARRAGRPDCCIPATRVALDVLRRAGAGAWRPLPARMTVFNPAMSARFLAERPTEAAELERLSRGPGCWSLGIGFGTEAAFNPNKWGGHLIARLDDIVIDLSAPQASRPAHGIELPGVLARLPGLDGLVCGTVNVNGCLVTYFPTPENVGYRVSPDWTGKRYERLVDEVFSAVS